MGILFFFWFVIWCVTVSKTRVAASATSVGRVSASSRLLLITTPWERVSVFRRFGSLPFVPLEHAVDFPNRTERGGLDPRLYGCGNRYVGCSQALLLGVVDEIVGGMVQADIHPIPYYDTFPTLLVVLRVFSCSSLLGYC